jgi:selenocysteine lyase/cysteine desulfurase
MSARLVITTCYRQPGMKVQEIGIRAYFNHAGLSRPSSVVTDRIRKAAAEYREWLFSEAGIERYYAMARECRGALARLLGLASPAGISILPSATTAVHIVLSALGAELKAGDSILTSDQEHPCVMRPLRTLERRGAGIIAIGASSAAEFLERISDRIRARRPAFAILSHVSYKDGRVLPVEDTGLLLAGHAIPFIVDGAQAFGHIPTNLTAMRADAYIFSGHKWVGGPWGTGGLWASDRFVTHDRFTLSNWEDDRNPADGGRYEGGTMNYAILAGLAEACRHAQANRDERSQALTRSRNEIRDRIGAVFSAPDQDADRLWRGPHAPGIVARLMSPRLNSWTLAARLLERHRVAVKPFRPPERPDAIRISTSPATTIEEIELLALALRSEA